jgi:3D-(3,5/4)-trihydroxycyclohexane-1,2-dione acylhydrolase (decyclizing)
MGATTRLTMAQAVVRFLIAQRTRRDDVEQTFFGGVFGIFGHGNVAGIGEALRASRDQLRYYLVRNEQAMVHTAAAYAKMHNRLRACVCTSSIGPGATNMITGAAGATINRLPVLLLPGDIFATRRPAPVLQQLESAQSQDISVNDCFKPVSRYWDRINRAEQIVTALPEALRVLTSSAETGAVTLSLPQDVQAEAFDYPSALFEPRVWTIARPRADRALIQRAADRIRASQRPMIVAGGGVIYSDATDALRAFVDRTGIAVGETQAGKGALPDPHRLCVGGVGATGTRAANLLARDADVVIVVGSRLSDFTTASKTAFRHPEVRFVTVNVTEFDAGKHAALPLVGDARAVLEELSAALAGYHVDTRYADSVASSIAEWHAEVDRVCADAHAAPDAIMTQAQAIGVLQESLRPRDVIVCAAGSLPGDLHKLWRAGDPKSYHLEYGYSCMGYEIAGGLGVALAAPDRDVYVLVGDGSYLMMAQEIVTAIQEHVKLTIVLFDNKGFASIGGLSESVGSAGFGTRYRYRDAATGDLDGDVLPVDLAANARSLGAQVHCAANATQLRSALAAARAATVTTVIAVPVDRESRVGGYDSWWDVPVAEVSTDSAVRKARATYEKDRRRERDFL